jgi:hypothetical protein
MISAATTARGLSDAEHSVQLRRAVIASTVGTVIESYDFLLYVLIAPLVFAKLYFPSSDPLVGTLQAFGIYAVGFISRPLGAAFFGHYGDRIGRKVTLIATLLITGLATFAVGFVPSYASIGIWGAIILTVVRFIQGIGIGGEWGGATLIAMEWAKTNAHRGFITAWPQWGAPAGLFVANIAVLVFSAMSGDQFLDWGWRVPFWLSIVMVGIGLWIRLGILETPVFQRILAEEQVARAPVLEVLRRQPKEIILTALARMGTTGSILHLCRLCLHLRHDRLAQLARPAADGGADRHRDFDGYDAALGLYIRPDRPQAHVPDRRGRDWHLRLRLLCDAEHDGARLDLSCDRCVADPARHDVRPTSRADRRMLHPAPALQRRLARLSSGLDHCRRTGAADCHRSPRQHRVRLFRGGLYPGLHNRQHCGHRVSAGLHKSRHLAGGCLQRRAGGRRRGIV